MTADDTKPRPFGYLLHDVTRLWRRRFDIEARAHGITLPQWKTLVHIEEQDPISQVALSNLTDTDPMTLSGILDRLEKRDLIERQPDPNDSRSKLVRLTKKGSSLVDTARHVGRGIQDAAFNGVSLHDRELLFKTLTRVHNNLSGLSADQKE